MLFSIKNFVPGKTLISPSLKGPKGYFFRKTSGLCVECERKKSYRFSLLHKVFIDEMAPEIWINFSVKWLDFEIVCCSSFRYAGRFYLFGPTRKKNTKPTLQQCEWRRGIYFGAGEKQKSRHDVDCWMHANIQIFPFSLMSESIPR